MCGILGVITPRGTRPRISRERFDEARDLLAHRGPDGAGTWQDARTPHVMLGHRRLAVVDPTDSGAQPMLLHDHAGAVRGALTYNGELYNDAGLRRMLRVTHAAAFTSECDTQTLLHACALDVRLRSGHGLRGMFAFAFYDAVEDSLTLTRDPLGVKPLLHARVDAGVPHLCFASEAPALLALVRALGAPMPGPDLTVLSAYFTTIRTTLGERTLFSGVRTLQPGQSLLVDLRGSDVTPRDASPPAPPASSTIDQRQAVPLAREVLGDSVRAHLRSDVPLCTLLSGGLDSAIVAGLARPHVTALRSFCAGARDAGVEEGPDFAFARECAERLGTQHEEAVVTRAMFAAHWSMMVQRLGIPLSTPNEVAIYEVARALRARGCIVTLSGEGADELFAGYDRPLLSALHAMTTGTMGHDPGRFELEQASWIPMSAKPRLVTPEALAGAGHDEALAAWCTTQFRALASERDDDDHPLQAHLRWLRRVNLLGLVQRLDTATMLAGVEGRVPFADVEVLRFAEALPLSSKLDPMLQPPTKRVLRDAFADIVPASVLLRPKASFPLPFDQWLEDVRAVLRDPRGPIRDIVRPEVLDSLASDPAPPWQVAWPVINAALWMQRWWG